MGREEQAKAERAELRRAVVDEALGRVGELEEKLAAHKKIINQQGRALEAIANAITAYARDVAGLQAQVTELRRPRGIARFVAYLRETAITVRRDQTLPAGAQIGRAASKVSIRRVDDPVVVKLDADQLNERYGSPAEVFDRRALDRLAAQPLTADNPGVPDISTAPEQAQRAAAMDRASRGVDHIHQYEKAGPFVYRCTVDGCDRRVPLAEIAAETEYLRGLDAGAKAK